MSKATDDFVFEVLSQAGIPGVHRAWGVDAEPPLPWFVYYLTGGGEVHADGRNYAALPRYRAELHTDETDSPLVDAFEAAVSEIGPYVYGEEYDSRNAAFVSTFDFTVC